jgi:NADH-quinone oxidoreductase subunit G
MTKLIVDGKEIEVPAEFTLLQACEQAGAEIPRFCFHERLSIAGNCRMCLVELKGSPKPVASCAWAVRDCRPGPNGEPPVVNTKTPMVKKAREGVMEFLLINHPLDCPICDQGGECDLQDQAMAYGVDKSRYEENKRAVEDKYIGPLVKTIMTRCIHCTRCIRFATEVAGVSELGAIGRGEDMEITTYLEKAMSSELQGNVIDLCPVGALTSKPYAFQARPWELTKTESIDAMDAAGSNIRVDVRGREVQRVMPRLHEDVNEEWISDKSRFIWDGLRTQRLDKPYVRIKGKLVRASWADAFAAIADKMRVADSKKVGAIIGDLATTEESFALKKLMDAIGSPNIDCRQDGSVLHPKYGRASYLFNATIAGIEQADGMMIIGANPRKEAPVINARIRKRWRAGGFKIGVIGEKADLTYDYAYLGAGPDSLADFVKHKKAQLKKQIWLIGQGALARPDGEAILSMFAKSVHSVGGIADGWNGFSVLHTAASRVGALDVGAVPGEGGLTAREMVKSKSLDVLFLLGADEIEVENDAFVVYIGTHGDRGAHRADVILPAAAYTEKSGIFVNTEGRSQLAKRAAFAPGDAREDWAILRALSDVIGHKLPWDSLSQLRQQMFAAHPHLAKLDQIVPADSAELAKLSKLGGETKKTAFKSPVTDFYLTNPIARASAIMAECSRLAAGKMPEAAE